MLQLFQRTLMTPSPDVQWRVGVRARRLRKCTQSMDSEETIRATKLIKAPVKACLFRIFPAAIYQKP
jgi:hypothetical protein